MINFPVLNSVRPASENNRPRKTESVKASKETAAEAERLAVPTSERRRDPGHEPSGRDQGRRNEHAVDVEV